MELFLGAIAMTGLMVLVHIMEHGGKLILKTIPDGSIMAVDAVIIMHCFCVSCITEAYTNY